jgi:hypothetical protein
VKDLRQAASDIRDVEPAKNQPEKNQPEKNQPEKKK